VAPPRRPSSSSRSRQQQKDRGSVEKKSDCQDEPTQHGFVVRTEQSRQIAHRREIGFCGPPLTLDGSHYDFRAVIQRNVASSLSCSTSSTCSKQKPASLTICVASGALRVRADADIKPAVERSPALHDWRESSKNALKEAPKQSAAPTAAAPSKAARSDGPLATITEPMRAESSN
jgi:hypothetical protein